MEKPPKPAVDENFTLLKQQAETAHLDALKTQATADTADLMARFGTKLALGIPGIATVGPMNGTM